MYSFLMQSTPNGSTYLQMIIMGCLLVCIIWLAVRQIKDFKVFVDEYKANKDILKQINQHVHIDGYRIFNEVMDGDSYMATLLSKDRKKCVLAEVTDLSNPEGVIQIYEF